MKTIRVGYSWGGYGNGPYRDYGSVSDTEILRRGVECIGGSWPNQCFVDVVLVSDDTAGITASGKVEWITEEPTIEFVSDKFYRWGSDGYVTLSHGTNGKWYVAWGLGVRDIISEHPWSVYEHATEGEARIMFEADRDEEMNHRR